MNGKQIIELADHHIGERYVLGSIAPKDDEKYRGPWDCAEFATWLVFQVSEKLYGCANNTGDPRGADAWSGFWLRDADLLGKKISINDAAGIPGAVICRIAGHGLIGHVVVSDGYGGTVEAHSTKDGVIKSVVNGRRWDFGVLVPWIEYSQPINIQPAKPTEVIYRYTIPMMGGTGVRRIQRALHIAVDGYFGHKTFMAVRAFQLDRGLVPDGEVGPKTAAALHLELR